MRLRAFFSFSIIFSAMLLTSCSRESSQKDYDFLILLGAIQGVQRAVTSQNLAQVRFDGTVYSNQQVSICDIDNSSSMSIRIEFNSGIPGSYILIQPVPPPVLYTFPGAFLDVDFAGAHFPADGFSCNLYPVQYGSGRYRASIFPGCQIQVGHVLDQLDIDCIPN